MEVWNLWEKKWHDSKQDSLKIELTRFKEWFYIIEYNWISLNSKHDPIQYFNLIPLIQQLN